MGTMGRMGQMRVIFIIVALMATALACNGAEPDVTIQLSNGEELHGQLETFPTLLQITQDSRIYDIPWQQVTEIRISPDSENLVQAWRFAEPGQNRKIRWGAPYPVRTMRALVNLNDGSTVTGRPSATALHFRDEKGVHKILILSKQNGKPGETLDQLVYPTRIAISGNPAGNTKRTTKIVIPPMFNSVKEVIALSEGTLIRLEARPGSEPGKWCLPDAGFDRPFLGIRAASGITAGWNDSHDEEIQCLVEDALYNMRDFFDDQRLLGVYIAPDGGTVYSLVLQIRQANTTLDRERNRPWRLAIIRWRFDPDEARLMAAGLGYFFRGIRASNEPPPIIRLSRELWNVGQAPL